MFAHTWLLPIGLLAAATLMAFPLSRYFAWIMDGKYRPLPVLGWVEGKLDSGGRTGSSTPGPCCCSTPSCSSSATWCWRCSRGCP